VRAAQGGWRALLGPAVPDSGLTISGLVFAPAAHGGVVANGLLPIVAALLAWSLGGGAPNQRRWIGVALITAGVAAIGGGDLLSAGAAYPEAWKGHALFALSALVLGGYMALVGRWGVHPADAAATVAIANVIAITPAWLLFLPSRMAEAPWGEIALQGLYQGLGPGFIGFMLFTLSITKLGAPRAGALSALVPAVTAVFGFIFLGEALRAVEIAGVALAVSGIAVVALAAGRR